MSPRPHAIAVGAGACLVACGMLLGLIGTLYATALPDVGPIPVPVGVLVAAVGNVALCWFGSWGLRSRAGGVCAAVGWLIAVLVLAWPRAEGDNVLPATGLGYGFLFAGVAAAMAGVVLGGPRLRRPAHGPGGPGGPGQRPGVEASPRKGPGR